MSAERRVSPLNSPLGSAGVALNPGMRVGRSGYVLKKLIGRGGVSEVWVAWDRKLEKDVALKFVPPRLMQEAHLLETIRAEVDKAKKLQHPSIVQIHDFVRDYETVAVAMEYVQGWSLAALKVDRPQKRYRVEELTDWILPLCEALEYAHHEICVVHRDIKPGNLLLNAREQVKITDFVIAQAVRSALAQQGHLVYGSIAYMSPQQLKGAEASVLDDVYSLGATLFDLLTGTPPFYAGEIMTQVFEVQPPTMSERLAQLEIPETLPKSWDEAIAAALHKDPAQRPQSANELRQWLQSPLTRVKPPTRESPPEQPAAVEVAPPEPQLPAATTLETEIKEAPAPPIAPEIDHREETLAEPEPPPQPLATAEVGVPEIVASEPNSILQIQARYKPVLLAGFAGLVMLLLATGFWLVLHSRSARHTSKTAEQMTGPPGSLDLTFHPGSGADNEIRSLAVQPDGQILAGGKLTNFDGTAVNGLARLLPGGKADTNFAPQVQGTIHAIAVQPDGKLLIGGDFMKVNGQSRKRIARIMTDGTLDKSFNPKGALNKEVRALLVQPDGRILAGGNFDETSGNHQNRLTRMQANGTRDEAFQIDKGANATIFALALQSDGKILAAGSFTRFANASAARMVRLNRDGSIDSSFKIGSGPNGPVLALLISNDEKILIAGNFTRVDGTEFSRVARLNSDGRPDSDFKPGIIPKGDVRCLAVQSSGKVLIAGAFNSVSGLTRNGIARLNWDGTLDQRFDPGQGATDGSIWALHATETGKVLIAGVFRDFNGTACARITRLNGDAAEISR